MPSWLTMWLAIGVLLSSHPAMSEENQTAPRNLSRVIDPGRLPRRVHVFEDYETEIERRWWLRGSPTEEHLAPSLSRSLPNRRAARATKTKDFDRRMGDQTKTYKAVIFNPVPGPPMGENTRLFFRYRLTGSDTLRVQIYSLTNNYHRHLVLTGLAQNQWTAAAVDMTQARRPDGSGGPLSKDERIDDIQFYIPTTADLWIDDIVLYDAAREKETEPFPRRVIFTGWFDTGKQGQEWPGDFEIVLHEAPRGWDAAASVIHPESKRAWLRIDLRGARPLSENVRLRFAYRITGTSNLRVELFHSKQGLVSAKNLAQLAPDRWAETAVDFQVAPNDDGTPQEIDEIRLIAEKDSRLLIDDLLLYEPGEPKK